MILRFAVAAMAIMTIVTQADPIKLTYGPVAGSELKYKIAISGSMSVEGYGEGLYAEGRGELFERALEADGDARRSEFGLTRGYLNVGGTYLPSTTATKVFMLSRDARRTLAKAEGEATQAAAMDPVLLCLNAVTGVILPQEPVEVGAVWDAGHEMVRLDGEEIEVKGESKLLTVREEKGRQIAVISSKLTGPLLFVYTDPMSGEFQAEIETQLFIDTGEVRSISGMISGNMSTADTAMQRLRVTFEGLTIEVALQSEE